MTKKRGRRAPPESDRRSSSSEPSNRDETPIRSHKRPSILITLLIFIVFPAISLYLYRIQYASNTDLDASLPYVYQRGLVKTDVNYQEILAENAKVSENASNRHFPYPVLAYVTPWNSRGYELAKEFNSKVTHISPVWYDLKSQGDDFVLEGRHNVDKGWISDLRLKGHALILPRIVLEAVPMDLLKKKKQRAQVIDLILAECKEMDFDGIVLESWSRWAAYGVLHDPHMRNLALRFIRTLGQAMHTSDRSLQLVYVIGPPRSDRLQEYDFGPEDLQSLGDAVDGYSLMTYDFSSPQNPGPNAPLKWVHATMQLLLGTHTSGSRSLSHKIFLGINFYGNDFVLQGGLGGGAILGRDYLSLLEKHKPELQWEKKSEEHFFFYSDENRHAVFYPSLLSIARRLDEARSWGAGISIWEIGQGLDYFFDLL
ncbi:chitinase domain-containing protein 1 [Cynara cardunculus var. scolymus]|uniref:chitinase domain-containing protein 1 n=1 Tax=Cynara cardunculus var. scolymus TaxID=59895 RepID=UPI000D6266BC|nr:chitinase domain-containing protein 1 [Cynara cardunculus var. scolymus]